MINWEEVALEYRSDPRSSGELLAIVKAYDMDADDEDYWKPVRILQHRLSSEIEVIESLSRSSDTKDQDDAATILGQNSVKDKMEIEPLCREIGDWQQQPLIQDCAEKLIEDRERFGEEWRLVYEQLEQAGFKSRR